MAGLYPLSGLSGWDRPKRPDAPRGEATIATTTHMNTVERMRLTVLGGVGRACRVPGPGRPAAGRDEVARLGLLTVGDRSGGDKLSRLALRSVDEGVRNGTGQFARVVSTGNDSP
jgi:hypothetical protein